jgi:hypothetical protein
MSGNLIPTMYLSGYPLLQVAIIVRSFHVIYLDINENAESSVASERIFLSIDILVCIPTLEGGHRNQPPCYGPYLPLQLDITCKHVMLAVLLQSKNY